MTSTDLFAERIVTPNMYHKPFAEITGINPTYPKLDFTQYFGYTPTTYLACKLQLLDTTHAKYVCTLEPCTPSERYIPGLNFWMILNNMPNNGVWSEPTDHHLPLRFKRYGGTH